PRLGDLDVLLLEDHLAVLTGDAGGAVLPRHLVRGVHTRRGEVAGDGEASAARRLSILGLPLLRRRGLQLTLPGVSSSNRFGDGNPLRRPSGRRRETLGVVTGNDSDDSGLRRPLSTLRFAAGHRNETEHQATCQAPISPLIPFVVGSARF